MADKTGGLRKKVGGQPLWAWPTELLAALLIYRRYRARSAANAANAALGTTSGPGPTTAVDEAGTPGTSSSVGSYATVQAWLAAVMAAIVTGTYSPTQAYNDLTSWLNGNCVSTVGAKEIGQAIETFGLPPGFGTPGPITVCPNTSTGTPKPTTPTPQPRPPSGGAAAGSGVVKLGDKLLTLISGPEATKLLAQGYNLYHANGSVWQPGQSGGNLYSLQGAAPATFTHLSPAQAKSILASGGSLWYGGPGQWQLWHPGVSNVALYSKS